MEDILKLANSLIKMGITETTLCFDDIEDLNICKKLMDDYFENSKQSYQFKAAANTSLSYPGFYCIIYGVKMHFCNKNTMKEK